jgi:hypothetical protein
MFAIGHPSFLREKARQLRVSKRLTIDELSERLLVSRSTVYYWVRDLPIPASERNLIRAKVGQRKGNRAMQARYRRLREHAYEEGRRSFGALVRGATFRASSASTSRRVTSAIATESR